MLRDPSASWPLRVALGPSSVRSSLEHAGLAAWSEIREREASGARVRARWIARARSCWVSRSRTRSRRRATRRSTTNAELAKIAGGLGERRRCDERLYHASSRKLSGSASEHLHRRRTRRFVVVRVLGGIADVLCRIACHRAGAAQPAHSLLVLQRWRHHQTLQVLRTGGRVCRLRSRAGHGVAPNDRVPPARAALLRWSAS